MPAFHRLQNVSATAGRTRGLAGTAANEHERRKLDQLDAVTTLDDLKVPPGNLLHALIGDLRGWHAVRVNDQYRIVFRFAGADACDVRCTDYH